MKGKKMHDECRGMFKSFKPRSLKDYSDEKSTEVLET